MVIASERCVIRATGSQCSTGRYVALCESELVPRLLMHFYIYRQKVSMAAFSYASKQNRDELIMTR